jgi:hypothetical protein
MIQSFKRRREEAIPTKDIWPLKKPAFKLTKASALYYRLRADMKDVRACEECYFQHNKATKALVPSSERTGKRLCKPHAADADLSTVKNPTNALQILKTGTEALRGLSD